MPDKNDPSLNCFADDGEGRCGLKLMARGMCNTHYARYMNRRRRGLSHEDALAPKLKWRPTPCGVDECPRQAVARGLCGWHWAREYGRKPCLEPGCAGEARGVHYTIGYCKAHASVAICLSCAAPVEKGRTGKQRCWCSRCDRCVLGCGRRREGRNVVCSMHLRRHRRYGSFDLLAPRTCTKPGCGQKHYGLGFCSLHWKRNYRSDLIVRQRNAVYDNRRRAVYFEPYDRIAVFDRDGWVCQICMGPIERMAMFPDARSPSIDHRVPISKGGHDTEANVQAAHLICNMSKGNRGGDPPVQEEDPDLCLPLTD